MKPNVCLSKVEQNSTYVRDNHFFICSTYPTYVMFLKQLVLTISQAIS